MMKLARLGQWLRSLWPRSSASAKVLPAPAAGSRRVVVQTPALRQLPAPIVVVALPVQLSTNVSGSTFYGRLADADCQADFAGVPRVSPRGCNRGTLDRVARDLTAQLFNQFALVRASGQKSVKVQMTLTLHVDRDDLVTLTFASAAR